MYDRVHVTLQQRTFESLVATEAEQVYATMHAHLDAVTHGYGAAVVATKDTHTLVARLVALALGLVVSSGLYN
jgi:hypothetical protein